MMDEELQALMSSDSKEQGAGGEASLRIVGTAGEIEVDTKAGPKQYTLKPLDSLYGQGHGVSSVDTQDDRFMPLLLCIEEQIVNCSDADPSLNDGLVALALDRLIANPATPVGNDVLCQRLQLRLRLLLSLNNYSQQEVKQALRIVLKSVERHSKHAGVTGYLDFIRRYVRNY
jgi:hypothetical protein